MGQVTVCVGPGTCSCGTKLTFFHRKTFFQVAKPIRLYINKSRSSDNNSRRQSLEDAKYQDILHSDVTKSITLGILMACLQDDRAPE